MTDPLASLSDLEELHRELLTELLVLRTALGAVIPHLSDDARRACDRALGKLTALLPVDRPDWHGNRGDHRPSAAA